MPLEVSKDVGGQWGVEIVGNGERAGGKPERPGRRRGRGDGTDFRDRPAPSDDDDVLPGLDSGKESRGVMGKFLRADSAHAKSLPLRDVAGKGRAKASIRVGNPAVRPECSQISPPEAISLWTLEMRWPSGGHVPTITRPDWPHPSTARVPVLRPRGAISAAPRFAAASGRRRRSAARPRCTSPRSRDGTHGSPR